jgi:hypothetical protein
MPQQSQRRLAVLALILLVAAWSAPWPSVDGRLWEAGRSVGLSSGAIVEARSTIGRRWG